MSDLARLMWLVEDLIYDDLLKGTGWGRRRGWYREQLESCRTIAQVCDKALQPGFLCSYGWLYLGIQKSGHLWPESVLAQVTSVGMWHYNGYIPSRQTSAIASIQQGTLHTC